LQDICHLPAGPQVLGRQTRIARTLGVEIDGWRAPLHHGSPNSGGSPGVGARIRRTCCSSSGSDWRIVPPNEIEIDFDVTMRQPVTHCVDLLPRHLGMLLRESGTFLENAPRRLSNDLQVPNYRVLRLLVPEERRFVQCRGCSARPSLPTPGCAGGILHDAPAAGRHSQWLGLLQNSLANAAGKIARCEHIHRQPENFLEFDLQRCHVE